ncbi:hypothetical protein CFOL_v3_18211 [Cephalotus follicularis]|uniref:Putative plant transposon protein domain-containing protein n=1 Tax=Cephalotus follicularis TaxID=3775 RepID=A0A1Q3C3K2_CEPFO|nr:hypothetical protein CFOL_v3_18211 [Cephalotus follicularis]
MPKKHIPIGKTHAGAKYKDSYARRKVLCGRIMDFDFTTGDNFSLEQWFSAIGWRDYFIVNVPYYFELVKEFYSNFLNVSGDCDSMEIKSKVSRTVIKFDDKLLGEILGVPAEGSKFFETKKWPEDPELVLEDCLRVFYPNENVFGGMAKPTNLLGAERRLLHHIVATHVLPTSGGHEKMSYQDLYIMWHVVSGKPLNLPHLIMRNMLRASSKIDGVLLYGMVITKIFSHFGIFPENEVPSRIDVGDIYNASSLKRMGRKREFDAGKGNVWLPKEGGRKRRVDEENVEEQGEPQRSRTTPAPQQQVASSSSNCVTLESVLDEIKKLNTEMNKMDIQMENFRGECLDLFDDQRRRHIRLEKKLVAKDVIEPSDISASGEEEEETGEEEEVRSQGQ